MAGPEQDLRRAFDQVASGDLPPRVCARDILAPFRQAHPELGPMVDELLLLALFARQRALNECRETQEEIRREIEKLLAPPWQPAIYLCQASFMQAPAGAGSYVVVAVGSGRKAVALAEWINPADLRSGEEVFLSREQNVVVARTGEHGREAVETARVDHVLPDGRIALSVRGETRLARPAAVPGAPDATALARQDMVCYDPNTDLVLEKVECFASDKYKLTQVPDVPLEAVGGLKGPLELLLGLFKVFVVAPERAAAYALSGASTVLLHGPSGCGKTLLLRVVLSHIQRLTGRRCYFSVLRPGEAEDPFVGVTGQNLRAFAGGLERAADEGMIAVGCFDELETALRQRGGFANYHGDKEVSQILEIMDGFRGRKDIVWIGLTNWPGLLDTAAFSRFSENVVYIGRPNMQAAQEIFGVHLRPSLPYRTNGRDAAATRSAMIASAVDRLYSPNADNGVATLRMRDGTQRMVAARDLISGRMIEQICTCARRRAFLRDTDAGLGDGEGGLVLEDIHIAIDEALARLRSTLTPQNCHAELDLPHDAQVVRVEPVASQCRRTSVYTAHDAA